MPGVLHLEDVDAATGTALDAELGVFDNAAVAMSLTISPTGVVMPWNETCHSSSMSCTMSHAIRQWRRWDEVRACCHLLVAMGRQDRQKA